VYKDSMGHNIYWLTRLYCMSPPYIYCRHRCRHQGLLHICHYDHCNSSSY
jgi:hypothetical protein